MLTMTRPRELETADSVTDSAKESQAGAALGSRGLPQSTQEQRLSTLAKETNNWSYRMAVDIYDTQYLLILAPSLVIALMFLFFWLFMKETSYDEVLARQKRDLKLPPTKPDLRKKNEKKKSKKKETASGGTAGGGGGESEEDLKDFNVADGAESSSLEEEPAPVIAPAPPAPAAYEPVSLSTTAPVSLRERKKKEKKAAKAAANAAAAALLSEELAVNESKPVSHKPEIQVNASKPSGSPPPPQPEVQAPILTPVQAPVQAQTPPQTSGKKKEKKKQKVEAVNVQQLEVKAEQAPAPNKKEAPPAAETNVSDAPSGKKKNSAKKQKTEPVDDASILSSSAASANHQAPHNEDLPSKGSGKKHKNETDKENAGLKLKELLSGLSSLVLSEAEAVSVLALIREKSPNALDAWHKSSGRPDPAAQEREKLLTTLQEEASIAKDKVKQLSQELQVEKQKTGRVEAMMREQRGAMEKELGNMQAKAQGSYQDLQAMQIKFQQVREQLESQISRLQQENGILRDAVSSATNQMENKNSAELNKLRSEYAGLMKELADSNSKLQQEEHQRKSLEVSYKQNVSQLEAQLQDAKRSWEELQNFLHNVNAEREKRQASKQELHSQLLAAESEMNNKNKEIQGLHSSLTDAMVSQERLEQRVMEFSQRSISDDSLQVQVQELLNENKSLQVQNESLQAQFSSQANHVSHIEELQKLLAEKELQRKSLEDSLNAERSSGASRETNMQALHKDNMSLKAEIQKLQAQISEQAASQLALEQFQKSVQEKEENMKTVEGLLEKGLIEVANKEEELKVVKKEKEALQLEIENIKIKMAEQASSPLIEELTNKLQEQDLKLKSMETSLQAELNTRSSQEETIEALQKQLADLKEHLEQQKKTSEELSSSSVQLKELRDQLGVKEQEIQQLQAELEAKTKESSMTGEQVVNQGHSGLPNPELLAALSEKQQQLCSLQEELELHRKKNNELREKNWSAMEALSATESMLQGKLSKAVKEHEAALALSQAECRDVLHRLLPYVPLPSGQNHQEWLQRFEKAAAESAATQSNQASPDSKGLIEKLKEAEETQRNLKKDCETYKKVLAETEGILQRLQSSVEEEETHWRMMEQSSQVELREMNRQLLGLEVEVERLKCEEELLIGEKKGLMADLERAEHERATYVTEVTELKTQLTETLSKLEAKENERQKVAGDLYKAQQSLELIQGELSKLTDSADDLIENSSLSSQREEMDKKEKMTAGLNQTVLEMQQLLQAVSKQLTKGQDGEAEKDLPKV
ncbi:kinectin isoform X2 [Oryzias melastigma]|uniref:Kinectin 1 n=1 Tax=Oryzias melastigma TaxID=30732 RepID=A0A3B3DYW1_ORYME|nr:kinectin isoform X2 [Oryzias melastigma]